MINRGGDKISPQEVEAALNGTSGSADAAACAIPHATLGEDVAAAVVLRQGTSVLRSPNCASLRPPGWLRSKSPAALYLIDSIPRTSTGKATANGTGRTVAQLKFQRAARPQLTLLQPVEIALIDIWRRILGVEQIEVCDDFFALGGDSLAVAVMLSGSPASAQTGDELLARVDFFDSADHSKSWQELSWNAARIRRSRSLGRNR